MAELDRSTLRPGESIAVYGFPLAGTLSLSGNIVAGNISALAGFGDDVRHYQISAPIQPGNSGGPLITMSGTVAGIVNAKLNELAVAAEIGTLPQNVNFSIKTNVAMNFLEAHSIPFITPSPGSSGKLLSLPDIVERARQFTVHIGCG